MLGMDSGSCFACPKDSKKAVVRSFTAETSFIAALSKKGRSVAVVSPSFLSYLIASLCFLENPLEDEIDMLEESLDAKNVVNLRRVKKRHHLLVFFQ